MKDMNRNGILDSSMMSLTGLAGGFKNRSGDFGDDKQEREMTKLTREVARLKRYQRDVSSQFRVIC